MIGTIRWNVILGLVAMILTFLVSIQNNVFLTSLMGSVYSFLFAFVIGFLFRWVLGTMVGMKDIRLDADSNLEDSLNKGNNLDLTTPDEEEALRGILKNQLAPPKDENLEFSPLNPLKLVSKEKIDPEDLAKVLRHLTEE